MFQLSRVHCRLRTELKSEHQDLMGRPQHHHEFLCDSVLFWPLQEDNRAWHEKDRDGKEWKSWVPPRLPLFAAPTITIFLMPCPVVFLAFPRRAGLFAAPCMLQVEVGMGSE